MIMNWTGVKSHSTSTEHLLCCAAALKAPCFFLFATGWHSWLITYWTQLCLTTHPGVELRRSRARPGILTLWRYAILNEPRGIQSHLAVSSIYRAAAVTATPLWNIMPPLRAESRRLRVRLKVRKVKWGKEINVHGENKTSRCCKSIVYPKMKTLPSFTHHDAVAVLLFLSVEHRMWLCFSACNYTEWGLKRKMKQKAQ